MKPCRLCRTAKPMADFYRRPGSPDGRRSECKECTKARVRVSVLGRPAEVAAYQRDYRLANRDRLSDAHRDRLRDPDRRAARRSYARDYRHATHAAALGRERRSRAKNRHKETVRRHARRAVPVAPDAAEFVRVVLRDPCSYCGADGGTIDHIEPVTAGGITAVDNLAGACLSCNSAKRTRPALIFLALRNHG